MSKVQKIKTHIKENKKTYIVGGVCFLVGAASVYFTSITAGEGPQVLQRVTQFGFRNEANPVIINLIERSTPSKPVHLVGTDRFFNSLSEAARETGHPLSTLSKHINGLIPNVGGDVFELLQPAA